MSKVAILASVVLLSGACGGAPDPPTAPNVPTPPAANIAEQLTETDRATIASMLSSIAVDAIEQALPEAFADAASSGVATELGWLSVMQPALLKRYEIRANHPCWFPYPQLHLSLGTLDSWGFIDVNWQPGSSGTISATLTLTTINTCVLGISATLGPQTWALDTSGLKVTSTIQMTPSGVAKRQVFRLQGNLRYFKGPYTAHLPVDLTHTYTLFPQPPVQASGAFGEMRLDRTLPEIEKPVRIPPPPSALTGQWIGTMAAIPDPKACPVEWNLELNLQASESALSGSATTRNTRVMFPSCADVAGHVATYGITGTAEPGGNVSFSAASLYRFTGTFSATRIAGRFTVQATGQPGSFVVYRQ